MPPKPFYAIDTNRYIFSKTEEKPEEKVRQWILFELLSTYGIHINSIEIERPVKVGTRTHFADIVIHKNGAPHVVIECKRWKNKKIEKGVDQAISYADANTVKAKYAVFTNGDVWHVKRKIQNEWVTIPDLNRGMDLVDPLTIDELIQALQELEPVLYWFSRHVGKEDANVYFRVLQKLFHGKNFPLDQVDGNLMFATDNLLRVIIARRNHEDYINGKMRAACNHYSKFFKEYGLIDEDLYELNKDDFFYLITTFSLEFDELVDKNKGVVSSETLMIRFVATLFRYFWKISGRQPKIEAYLDVPKSLNDAFHDLLNFHFQIRIGIEYPDPLSNNADFPLSVLCSEAWNTFKTSIENFNG